MRRGVATLMIVLIAAMLGTFMLTAWMTRLLLSVQRFQAVSDVLSAEYHAESEVNDIIAKFRGNYPAAFNFPILPTPTPLPDGTKITIQGTDDGSTQNILINASRQFSTIAMQVSRKTSQNISDNYDQLEITLALDCTTSMDEPANTACRQLCCNNMANCSNSSTQPYRNCMTANNCTTRLQELKKAALSFTDSVQQFAFDNPTKAIRLGTVVFRVDAGWLSQPSTDINSVRSRIENGWSTWQPNSNACKLVNGSTSVGSGFDIANAYFGGTAQSRKKQVTVLITDGEPNSRHDTYSGRCGMGQCTVGDPGCPPRALEFMQCGVATIPDGGARNPTADAYAVTVLDHPPANVSSILQQYATAYYNSGDASNLTDILAGIFGKIVSSVSTINFQRVVPTP